MKALPAAAAGAGWQRRFDEHVGAVGMGACFVLVWDRMPRARVWKQARSERGGSSGSVNTFARVS